MAIGRAFGVNREPQVSAENHGTNLGHEALGNYGRQTRTKNPIWKSLRLAGPLRASLLAAGCADHRQARYLKVGVLPGTGLLLLVRLAHLFLRR